MNMMGLAKRVKARILQASTSEIYGDPEACPTGSLKGEANKQGWLWLPQTQGLEFEDNPRKVMVWCNKTVISH